MGATIRKKIKFLLCDHQQEEPDELRGSRPVPWEGGGAIPLPDPIVCYIAKHIIETLRLCKLPKVILMQ
jgi:hypothetical protein